MSSSFLRYVPWFTIVGIMRCIVAKQNITASKHSRARIRDINTDLWQKKYEQYLPFYRISRCCKIWPATLQQHWHCHNIWPGLFICLGSPFTELFCVPTSVRNPLGRRDAEIVSDLGVAANDGGRIVKWCTQSTLFCYQTFTLLRELSWSDYPASSSGHSN